MDWSYAEGYCFAPADYRGPCRRVESFTEPVYAELKVSGDGVSPGEDLDGEKESDEFADFKTVGVESEGAN